jgi:hypothetical protein
MDVEAMKDWLVQASCTLVIMASAVSHCRPVCNVLGGQPGSMPGELRGC